MLINNFSGGLSKKISPHLIPSNFSTICLNAYIEDGAVEPEKGSIVYNDIIDTMPIADKVFTIFKNKLLTGDTNSSFTVFNNKLYCIKNPNWQLQESTDGINFYDVGITRPSYNLTTNLTVNLPTLSFSNYSIASPCTLITNTEYKYLAIITSKLNKTKLVYLSFNYTGVNGVKFDISSMEGITSISLYRLYEDKYKLIAVSTSATYLLDQTLDISDRSTALTYSNSLDNRKYAYTYANSVTGVESAPSSSSFELDIVTNSVVITGFINPNTAYVDTINLYRMGGTLNNYYLVTSLPITTTTYTDTKTDLEVLDGTMLDTQDLIKPPSNLLYLTSHSSALFAVKDNKLYFSNPGLPRYWTDFNYIEFEYPITGLASTSNGLLVFSLNTTWLIAGTDASNFSKYLLHTNQGCSKHSSIAYIDNNAIWVSIDGICISNGSRLDIISEQYLGKLTITPIVGVIYENSYYLFHTTGCLIVDFKSGIRFRETNIVVKWSYYEPSIDKLLIIKPNSTRLEEYGIGLPIPYTYKTGYLAEGFLTNYKTFKSIYLYIQGYLEVKLYGDGVLLSTYSLVHGFNEILFPQSKTKLYYIELEFSGLGKLLELEFKVEGRQNGR